MSIVEIDVDSIQRRSLSVLSGASALSGIAVAGSIAAGGLLAARLAGSEGAAGLAQTAGVLGAAALSLPLARIAMSRGRRAALSVGFGIGAVGALVVIVASLASSLWLLLVGCLLVGVASAATFQSRYAATDLAEDHQRARALSWVVWAGTIGAVIGPNLLNISGSLGSALGLEPLAGPYVVSGVALTLAVVILVVFLRPDPYLVAVQRRAADGIARVKPKLRDGIGHLKAAPQAVLGIIVISVGHLVMVMVMVMTPVHMDAGHSTLQLIGLVISIHVLGMFAFAPVVGILVDRFGRLPMALTGAAILIASCVIAGTAGPHRTFQLGLGLFLLGLGWSFTLISGSTMVTDAIAAENRPAVQGLSDLAMNVAGALGGIMAGLIVVASSYEVLCFAAIVPLLLLVVLPGTPWFRGSTRAIVD
jgi:MFS family permease